MKILGIDPGTTKSGVIIYDTTHHKIPYKDHIDNNDLLCMLPFLDYDEAAIEILQSYGMPVGNSIFETGYWIGKFELEIERYIQKDVFRYTRKEVLQSFGIMKGGKSKTDTMLRHLLLDKFPGGKGSKKLQTELYGVSGDMWSALAIAMNHHCERDYKGVNKFMKASFDKMVN